MAIPYFLARAIRAAITFVVNAVNFLCAFTSSFWFAICRLVVESSYRRVFVSNDAYHKILVVGDSLAEGFGDYVVCGARPGVAARMERKIAMDDQYRHQWMVFNRGVMGSNTRDWLTTASSPQFRSVLDRMRWWLRVRHAHNTLWDNVFNNPAYEDGEIVLVMMGSSDFLFEIDAKETCDNIISFSQSLSDMGKTVMVCPVPEATTRQPEFEISPHANAINTMLQKRCDDLQKVNYKITFGDQMHHLLANSSSRHPDSEGYKALALHTLKWLTNAIVAVEFDGIKRMFSGKGKGPASKLGPASISSGKKEQ